MLGDVYIPILHAWPWAIPNLMKLGLFFPLVAAVAVVYRATRVRKLRDMPWDTVVTFFNIVVGMALIAIGFYAAYEIVIRFF